MSPFTLTYPDLLAQPTITEIVTLECVGNGVAGEAIGTAEWQGVRLKALLDRAGVTSQTQDVVFHAADGYSDSLTIERAMMDDIMVAYRMNGVPLPLGHGFPARMIVPGHYGMKHVQWLTGTELDSSDNKGYYPGTDWSDEAIVKTKSWIMDSRNRRYPNRSEGVHHAGLCLCEILGDLSGGHQHRRRRILVGRDPCPFIFYSWAMWSSPWEPQLPVYRILAGATGGTGEQQSTQEHLHFPDWVSGRHEEIISII